MSIFGSVRSSNVDIRLSHNPSTLVLFPSHPTPDSSTFIAPTFWYERR